MQKKYFFLFRLFYGGTPGIAHNNRHGSLCVYKHQTKIPMHKINIANINQRISIFTAILIYFYLPIARIFYYG